MPTSHDWPWVRVTGILGILFFVGTAIGLALLLPTQPLPTDPVADIEQYFIDDASLLHTSNWIMGATLVFIFLPFASGLRSFLASRDIDAGMWSRVAFGSAVALVAVTGAGAAFAASAALAVDAGPVDETLLRLMLWADAFVYSFVVALGIGLFLAATSVVLLRTGALARWLGWLGLAIALLCVIGAWWPITGDPDGAIAMLAFLSMPLLAIWTLLAGIDLLRTPRPVVEERHLTGAAAG